MRMSEDSDELVLCYDIVLFFGVFDFFSKFLKIFIKIILKRKNVSESSDSKTLVFKKGGS